MFLRLLRPSVSSVSVSVVPPHLPQHQHPHTCERKQTERSPTEIRGRKRIKVGGSRDPGGRWETKAQKGEVKKDTPTPEEAGVDRDLEIRGTENTGKIQGQTILGSSLGSHFLMAMGNEACKILNILLMQARKSV